MKQITRYSNWCEYDQLDGVDLVDGEHLLVEWPDGNKERVTIRVMTDSYETSDMGHRCDIPTKTAHVVKDVNGVAVKVPLLGVKAKRVKCKHT